MLGLYKTACDWDPAPKMGSSPKAGGDSLCTMAMAGLDDRRVMNGIVHALEVQRPLS